MDTFVSSAPGKIILSGEHSVVHGKLAIASVIEKRTFSEFIFSKEKNDFVVFESNRFEAEKIKICEHKWNVELIEKKFASYRFLNKNNYGTAFPDEFKVEIELLVNAIKEFLISDCNVVSPSELVTFTVFLFYYIVFGLHEKCVSKVSVMTYLPISSGLGSSASYSVSLAQGSYFSQISHERIKFSSNDLKIINAWAFEAEKISHGNPSGVDNTVILYGGALAFRKGLSPLFMNVYSLRLMVVDSCQSRDSKKLIAGVNSIINSYPAVLSPLLNSFNELSLAIANSISGWTQKTRLEQLVRSENVIENADLVSLPDVELDYTNLIRLISMNHSLLNALGVGHPKLELILSISRKYSIFGKLTGAGGGGCVILLIPPNSTSEQLVELQQELLESGFISFEAVMGQEGAKIEM